MEEKQSNGLAIASMVLGIVSLILTCILPYSFMGTGNRRYRISCYC